MKIEALKVRAGQHIGWQMLTPRGEWHNIVGVESDWNTVFITTDEQEPGDAWTLRLRREVEIREIP